MKGTGVSNILIILFFAHFFVHLHAESQWKNTFDDLQEVYNTRGHRKQSKYALLRNFYEQRRDKQSTETNDSQKSPETESAETSEENDSNERRKLSNSLRPTSNSNSNGKLDSLENIVNNYREIKQILSHKHGRENKRRKDSNSDDNSGDVDSSKITNSGNSSSNSSDESSNSSDESSNSSDESSSISSDKSSPKSRKELEENSKRRKRHNLRRHNPKSDDSSSSSDSSASSESNESSDESRSSEETSNSTNSNIVSPKEIERRGTSRHPRNENLNAFIKQFYQNKLLEGRGKISDAQENLISRRNALWEQLKSKIEWLNNPQNSSFDIHLLRPKNNSTQETATNYSINNENHFSVNGKWNVTKNFLLSKSETPDGKYINTIVKINKIFYNDEKNQSDNSTDVGTSSLAPEIETTTEDSTLNLQSDVTQTGHSTFDTPIIGNASPPGFQVNAPPGFQVNAPPGFQVNAPPGLVNNHAASNWYSPFGHVILNSGASRNINPEIEDNSGTDEAVDKSENDAAKQDKVDLSDSTESNLVSKETSEVEIVKDNSIESAGSSIESKHDSAENDTGNINKHSTTTVENTNNSGETTSETLEYKSVPINDEIHDLENSDNIQKKSDVKQQSASVLPAIESLVDDLGESPLKDVLQNRNLTMDLINFILSLTKGDGTTSKAPTNNNVKIEVNGDR